MKKNIRTILVVVFVILVLVFLYSAYRVTRTMHEYHESARYYERTRKDAVVIDDSPAVTPAPGSAEAPQQRTSSPVSVDFDSLLSINPDVKAWLYSPDTKIDYPVVQSKDNAFYLYRLMDGSYNPGGTLFIDYRNMGDFTTKNTVIYGHHMGDGSMLASLVDYAEQSYYDEHPFLFLNTPEGNYRLDVFAGFVTWYDSRVYTFDFGSRTEFEEWVNLMRSYSDFLANVEISLDDRIVTLSTCTYEYDNARYVLMAKLVPLDD